jgi:transcriptional regulator with XRE-family HTH domain
VDKAVLVKESDIVAAMRRELGRQLAERRKASGYVQRELGVLLGYSRTAVANAETGVTRTSRQLWERADRVLETGELFARGHDRIRAQAAAGARAEAGRLVSVAEPDDAEQVPAGLTSLALSQARQACLDRGWPAEEGPGGQLWLLTGSTVDVLEVPRPAGIVTMGWWLFTRGVPDEIRGLPALPDPAGALAVISAGPRCYFLVRSGMCPWTLEDMAAADASAVTRPVVVRWHADGGRVPAPPSLLAKWAHVPSGDGQLVSPMALLHVLAEATAATREDAGLLLPGGVCAVPATANSLSAGPA